MLDVDRHLARDDVLVREHLLVVVDRPAGNLVCLEQLEP